MAYKITKIDNSFIDGIQKESMDELNTFYGIDWKDHTPKIIVVDDRETIDYLHGEKTEKWLVAWATKDKTIYILNKDSFGTESDRVYSDVEYVALVKHELSHLYFRILSKGNQKPIWLNEGLAIYTSGQLALKRKPENFNHFLDHHDNGGKTVYDESGFVVQKLVEQYGKEKILKLIANLNTIKNSEDFQILFKDTYGFELDYKNLNEFGHK
jgi:hypothetical protein